MCQRWIQTLMFLQTSSLCLIYPFLNLHMISLGFNTSQVTLINVVISLMDLILPIFTGIFADRIGNFRLII